LQLQIKANLEGFDIFSRENMVAASLNGEAYQTYIASATSIADYFSQIRIAAYDGGRTLKKKLHTSNSARFS
jgi:hypothetical protein